MRLCSRGCEQVVQIAEGILYFNNVMAPFATNFQLHPADRAFMHQHEKQIMTQICLLLLLSGY